MKNPNGNPFRFRVSINDSPINNGAEPGYHAEEIRLIRDRVCQRTDLDAFRRNKLSLKKQKYIEQQREE